MKKAVIVLGMHRSGTSALAGALNILGVDLGENLLIPDEYNVKGFYENWGMVNINIEILNFIGGDWHNPTPFEENWWKSEHLGFIRERISSFLMTFNDKALIGFKDPRLCRLLPIWLIEMEKLSIKPVFVIPLRDPYEVCSSLKKRDCFSREKSLLLWMIHNIEAERYSRNYPRVVVTYNDLLSQPVKVMETISAGLDIKFPYWENKKDELSDFIEKELKHAIVTDTKSHYEVEEIIYNFYNYFVSLKDGNEDSMLNELEILENSFLKDYSFFYSQDMPFLPKKKLKYANLYINTGDGFSDSNKICKPLIFTKWNEFFIKFDITCNPIVSFGFNPAQGELIYLKLDRVLIANGEHVEEISISTLASNGFKSDDGVFVFESLDPQIIIPVSGCVSTLTINGELVVFPLVKSVDEIIKTKLKIIEETEARIKSLYNSYTWKTGRAFIWLPELVIKKWLKFKNKK